MYGYFSAAEVTPLGWLRRQLELQAEGLAGHLDQIWPDVRDSRWIGGNREGWERVPYWLDGFIPLAWLLRSEEMQARAQGYVDAILSRQCEDGWICPCADRDRGVYDIWAHFLICKVLALYGECSADPRVISALTRAMECLYRMMKNGEISLHTWGKSRWFECMIPLAYLEEHAPQPFTSELAQMLRAQGLDYPSFRETWKRPVDQWTHHTHIVNMAMMLKYEAVTAHLLGEEITGMAEELWAVLEAYNGTAVGTVSGDECLSGLDSNRGTELCSVVELMYSFEILYALTDDPVWAERLERVAFNALPATVSDDMWTHQYDQMVNQPACITFPRRSHFRTNSAEAHIFGLEPAFGCCTANFGQGWPKLALSIFRRRREGISITSLLPAQLETEIGGTAVRICIDSEYPFRHRASCRVESEGDVRFSVRIRIPEWAKSVTVDGMPYSGRELILDRCWQGSTTVTLEFTDTPRLIRRPHDLYAVQCGALIYSLPVGVRYEKSEYTKNDVERKYPYCDYQLHPTTPWAFGFADPVLTYRETEGDTVPFSSTAPRCTVEATLVPVAWPWADGFDSVPAAVPASSYPIGEARTVSLWPYGSTRLRMTELPLVI